MNIYIYVLHVKTLAYLTIVATDYKVLPDFHSTNVRGKRKSQIYIYLEVLRGPSE